VHTYVKPAAYERVIKMYNVNSFNVIYLRFFDRLCFAIKSKQQ